ncbi:MAG: metallophosphoesterase family protein [Terrisporobacter sp.]|uniref:metallophosphoesterase family protein n=1 Tax=Clostridia TaxID=186801 RepID=UPI002FCBD402
MKIAAISDIHGNIYALMKVLEDINQQKIDLIVCLGDLVGYGPHPNEVIALIRRRELPCIKGNYDSSVVDGDFTYIRDTPINSFSLPWTIEEIRASNKYYLNELPSKLNYNVEGVNIEFVHGSPNSINEYLFEDSATTKSIMDDFSGDILVCAHTHIPSLKKFNEKIFVNVGSVGKPKIGRPNATYCILDVNGPNDIEVEFKELEYEYKKIVKDCTMLNFPGNIINSYETGQE